MEKVKPFPDSAFKIKCPWLKCWGDGQEEGGLIHEFMKK